MARNSIRVKAAASAVFDVLDDARAYPRWVVGARRIRGVDPTWPAVGAEFRHALGTAVGELGDSTKILERDRPKRIKLEVRFRPIGIATVEIQVVPDGEGSVVSIEEVPIAGLASRLPRLVVDPLLTFRNGLALQRLRHEVELTAERATASELAGR